jgi:type VI secretion system Hcp family effector
MAFDSFIKFDGIEGESMDAEHRGWIEISSYRHGIRQKGSITASSAGGAGSGRGDFGDFLFTKQMDKASPKLAICCAAGTHFDKVVLDICRAGDTKLRYMRYELINCMISGYSAAGGTGVPAETVTVDFGKISMVYTQQKRDGGGPAGNIIGSWDRQRNCKF